MNPPSSALAELPPRPEAPPADDISAARRLSWSVRRELWENRSILLAPLVVGGVSLLGFLLSLPSLPSRLRAAAALGPMQQHAVLEQPYLTVALILMAVELLVAVFYSLDALYGERRDRSVLFWKSLPTSDGTAVAAKASIPILLLPLVTFAVTVATQLVMLLVHSAVLAGSGLEVAMVWRALPFFKTSLIHLVHLVGYHGLWYAPFYGWLLLASAWSRRVPFLWAMLPPVAIGVVERIALGTSHFGMLLLHRFGGGSAGDATTGGMTMDMLASDWSFLVSPGMWLGLALTAVFLYAAARLRRVRGPI